MATPMSIPTFARLFLRSQLLRRIPYPTSDFSGQTIIVTGSNTGLGLEAARHLVRLRAAKVILAVRTIKKGEEAASDILKTTGVTKDVVEVWPLDLSSYESIGEFGARVQKMPRLDAVIQNAGAMTNKFTRIEEDEFTIRVNVIAASMIGLSVLPKLRETAKKFNTRTRLSFVGSDTFYIAGLKEADTSGSILEALNDEEKAAVTARYSNSKLLLFYVVQELAARSPISPDSNVIINVLTPGLCKSNLFRDEASWAETALLKSLHALLARTQEVGGRTLVDAVRPDIDVNTHGQFLMDCEIGVDNKSVSNAKGQALARRFNDEVFAKVEGISPGIISNVLH